MISPGSVFSWFWHQLGSQNLPKMEPSWIQNRSKLGCWFDSCFGTDLGTIFIGFCMVCVIRPCYVDLKNWIKMVPRSLPKQLSNQHPNLDRFWNQLGFILGGFGEPSWSQVGTKSLQKSIQKVIKKSITFRIALGTNFDRFWPPTWPPKNVTFVDMLGTCWLLMAP